MYFRARYFDSTTGEFCSQDPLEYVDGMSTYRGYFALGLIDPWGLHTITGGDFSDPYDESMYGEISATVSGKDLCSCEKLPEIKVCVTIDLSLSGFVFAEGTFDAGWIVVNGKKYPFKKHNGSSQTICFDIKTEKCSSEDKNRALNVHLVIRDAVGQEHPFNGSDDLTGVHATLRVMWRYLCENDCGNNCCYAVNPLQFESTYKQFKDEDDGFSFDGPLSGSPSRVNSAKHILGD